MELFNFTGTQRVDTSDLTDATNTAILGAADDLAQQFLLQPGVLKVVSGFAPSAPSAGAVMVGAVGTPNVAFLAERSGAQVAYGRLMVGGQDTQTIDVSSFAAGAYGIYVRLSRLPGVAQNRTFWAALDQVEQARLTQTRLVCGWEVRIEAALPSAEWHQIGQAQVTAGGSGQGNTVAVRDQRQMYFSGPQATAGAPVWGTAADRAAATSGGLVDLYTTLDALKACLVDVKGPGTAAWTQSYVSGLNLGAAFAGGVPAVPGRLSLGDPNIYLAGSGSGGATQLNVQFGPTDALICSAFTGNVSRVAAGQTVMNLTAQGYLTLGTQQGAAPLTVNSVGGFGGGELGAFYNRGAGPSLISLWTQDRLATSAAFQAGYISEYPYPRVMWVMGTVNGNVQAALFANNNQSSPAYQTLFRVVGNSSTPGDLTAYYQTRNVALGTNGTTQIYGQLLYGNARVSYGGLPWATGVVVYSTTGQPVNGGIPSFTGPPGLAGNATLTPLPSPAGPNDNKSMRLTVAAGIPNNVIVSATLLAYAGDGTDQRGYTLSYNQVDGQSIDFYLRGSDGLLKFGSFAFSILNGA